MACSRAATPPAHSNASTADPLAQSNARAASPPSHPKFRSTGLSATWIDPETGLNVSNDMWNCPRPECGRQEVWVNSSSNWGVVSDMAKGNTTVLTYPAVQRKFGANGGPAPLATAQELRSTFTESMPTTSGTIGEAAYDIWLNDWNTEIMIWVDNQHQHFSTPIAGIATINGQKFAVYATQGTSGGYPRGPFIFVIQKNETSGTVDILDAIRWVEHQGYMSASGAGLNAVDFGWEICSTNGEPQYFAVSRFSLFSKGI
jgi:hypothetical protein